MKVMLDRGATMPTKSHDGDVGYDLYSRQDAIIYPIDQKAGYFINPITGIGVVEIESASPVFDTGVHVQFPPGMYGRVEGRSGLNVRHNIVVGNTGIIDNGYVGSIMVKLYNLGTEPYQVHAGDKVAQLVIQPYAAPELELAEELSETDRGANGFGSTGR